MGSRSVAMNDLMAIGAIDSAQDENYEVPKDLSVIGFDNREFTRFSKPKLTTVELPLKQMGNLAAEYLQCLIEGKDCDKNRAKLECSIIQRESTAYKKDD